MLLEPGICVSAAVLGLAAVLLAACSEHSPTTALPTTTPALESRADAPSLPAEPFDPSAQIKQLKELRDKGLITEDEFQQKKKHLLERQ